jgi:polysaccharide deacetylase family protein (PEP-CTERM system associated)
MPASITPRRYEEPPIVLTFDLEEWFCLCGDDYYGDARRWGSFEPRVETITQRLLEILAEGGHRATFFVLGWVARRHPRLVREIAGAGHEIGFHTMRHRRRGELSDTEFRAEAREGRLLLEDLSGAPVAGFRAAEWSIYSLSDPALALLAEEDYRYDSSVTPVPLIGRAGNDPYPSQLEFPGGRRLTEFPPLSGRAYFTTVLVGGSWAFRSIPFRYLKRVLDEHRAAGAPAIFDFHPWEFDRSHPHMTGLPALSRLAHFGTWVDLEKRFRRLLSLERTRALGELL